MPELFESRPGAFSHPIGPQREGTTEIAEHAEENQEGRRARGVSEEEGTTAARRKPGKTVR